MKDGVHIGIVPETKDQKSDQKHDLLRRIPRDAEACTVLVGCLDYLDKPAMAFVRLAERQVLENLTEVPLPVRFVFILLGPEGTMDYHEVGRSLSTLMSNQVGLCCLLHFLLGGIIYNYFIPFCATVKIITT